MALFNQPTMFSPNVDPTQETVEGRIGGLLQTDDRGNYTNQVVRQAQDRQEQSFNARGLRNSSIAVQGGTEAAISKAVEIASPDAKTYYDNRRGNMEMVNADRKGYQGAVQGIATNYQRQLDTINASQMDPEDKTVAIQQAGAARDGEMTFQNNLYARMPGWQSDWLAPVVPTAGMDINTVSNPDTLSNVANDPGQTQEQRAAALARMQSVASSPQGPAIIGGVGGGMIGNTGVPAVGTSPAGQQLPAYDPAGRFINWNTPVRSATSGQQMPLAQAYDEYHSSQRKSGRPSSMILPPAEWYAQMYGAAPAAGGGGPEQA